jgi:multidrug resistance efflux pump
MPNLINNPTDIQLNERDDIQALLGNPPSWMLRFGVWAVAGVLALLFALAWFIKYPEVVEAKVIFVTENPPIRVFARASGRVQALLVKNQQRVQRGDLLAVLDNTADWKDVLKLEKMIESDPLSILPSNHLNLGNLQSAYSTFSQNWKDYSYFTTKTGIETKIQFINNQIDHLEALNANLQSQKGIQEQEFALAESEFSRQKRLYTEGVNSASEYEKFQSTYLQQKRQIEATQAQFINNAASIGQQQSQINDLRQSKNDNTNTKQLTLEEDRRRLREAIAAWKQNYLLIAPIAGTTTLTKIWSAEQNINTGEELLTIVPDNSSEKIVGKATLPIAGSGKVVAGLIARIQLADFPARQFGIVEGTVTSIAAIPQKDEYMMDIALPQSLATSYGKPIPFRQEMQGLAKIVTKDRRIVLRLFDQWDDLLKNQ